MASFKSILVKISNYLMANARKKHCEKLRSGLTNSAVTLLTNNCSGGIIYHDLGLRFDSPTVNLSIPNEDFIKYLKDIDYYCTCPIKEVFEEGINYPIGMAGENEKAIKLKFMHYHSFDEAVAKWYERSKRIDKDNVRVIFEIPEKVDQSLVEEFNALPYKNKVIITGRGFVDNTNACYLNIYDKNYIPGKLFRYKGLFSTERFLEDFDYVSFINND